MRKRKRITPYDRLILAHLARMARMEAKWI
jgi:hypothetical protein